MEFGSTKEALNANFKILILQIVEQEQFESELDMVGLFQKNFIPNLMWLIITYYHPEGIFIKKVVEF